MFVDHGRDANMIKDYNNCFLYKGIGDIRRLYN